MVIFPEKNLKNNKTKKNIIKKLIFLKRMYKILSLNQSDSALSAVI